MKRDYKLYINDIKECIKFIEKFTQGISEQEFKSNVMIQDAVIRRIEIIGEASRNIPRSLKEKNKHIPWQDMSDFRNFISHSYYEASMDRVWRIVKNRIPQIKETLNNISLV